MRMLTPRFRRGLGAVIAAGALLAAAGCDWLQGSGPGTRASPFLSSLAVAPTGGVFCGPGNPFTVSFRYDDPQDDIFEMRLTLVHAVTRQTIENTVLWTDMNLSDSGRASWSYTFACGNPGGRWDISVQVEDEDGHTSNILTGAINLNSL